MALRFSLAYTSRRALAIEHVVGLWRREFAGKSAELTTELEVVLSIDKDYPEGLEVGRRLLGEKKIDKLVENAGANCVSGWNTAAEATTGDVIIAVADDFKPPHHWDHGLAQLYPNWWAHDHTVWVSDGYNTDIHTLTIMSRVRYNRFGYLFYPEYESLFCLPTGTLVWLGDYSFKPIELISQGDSIIGSVRRVGGLGKKGHTRNFLSRGKVLCVKTRIAPVVKITLASGKVLRSTADHLWGAYYSGWRNGQRRPRGATGKVRHPEFGDVEYAEAEINRPLIRVVDVPKPAPLGSERDLGWLSGLYDGEGNSGIFLTQSSTKNGDVCREYERLLTKYGFSFSKAKSLGIYNVYTILGGRDEYTRLLNWTRSVRHNRVSVDKKMLTSRYGTRDPVVSIEHDGVQRVYCLKTDTRNYVADGYLTHNSDTENTVVASLERAVIDARHMMFEHLHPDCNKRGRDAVDLKHASSDRWKRGEMLFKFREKAGFPIDAGPLAPVYDPEVKLDFALYVQAIKDDIALYDVCARIIEEGRVTPNATLAKVYLCVPDEYWSGRKTTDEERHQVIAVGDRLNKQFMPETETIVFGLTVGVHRIPGRSRIDIETRVRNDSVAAVNKHGGFKHILIADGDELWRRGLLATLCDYVREHNPAGVFTGMVPVVGLPGLAVDKATDKASIYINSEAFFTDCRGTSGFRHDIPGHPIIHFTAVRPSMDAIISKNRESGHYDDPSYDFEGWIKTVLPNLKRDSKNLHMFKSYQIWPNFRPWTQAEWTDIPDSLKQHLDNWVATTF